MSDEWVYPDPHEVLYPQGTDPFGVGHTPKEGTTRMTTPAPGFSLDEAKGQKAADIEDAVANLKQWWRNLADDDAEVTAPKAIEYGSLDLDIMGEAMMALNPDAWQGATPAERKRVGQEMAIIFYLQGKIGRALSSLQQGQIPKDDTRFDTRIYANMWEYVARNGAWLG